MCVNADFKLGGRTINEYNIGGLISAIVSAVAVILLALFFVNDPPLETAFDVDTRDKSEPLLSPTVSSPPIGVPKSAGAVATDATDSQPASSYTSLTGSAATNSLIVSNPSAATTSVMMKTTELQIRTEQPSTPSTATATPAAGTTPTAAAAALPPLDTSISVFCLCAYAVVSGQALGQFETIAIPLAISDYGFTSLENGFFMAGFGAMMFVTLQLISRFLKQRAATAAAAAAAASNSDFQALGPQKANPKARTSSSYDRSFIFVGKLILFASTLLLIRWPPSGGGARSSVAFCIIVWAVFAVGSTLSWGMYIPLFSKIVGARPQGTFMGFLVSTLLPVR
jgi:hypothetical protein